MTLFDAASCTRYACCAAENVTVAVIFRPRFCAAYAGRARGASINANRGLACLRELSFGPAQAQARATVATGTVAAAIAASSGPRRAAVNAHPHALAPRNTSLDQGISPCTSHRGRRRGEHPRAGSDRKFAGAVAPERAHEEQCRMHGGRDAERENQRQERRGRTAPTRVISRP